MNHKIPPSVEFENAIRSAGTPVIDCGFCGRTNYISNGRYMDEGELEELEKYHALYPDKYHAQPYDSISFGYIFGRAFVLDCPCNLAHKLEEDLWKYRHEIIEYFKLRTESEKKSVDITQDLLNSL